MLSIRIYARSYFLQSSIFKYASKTKGSSIRHKQCCRCLTLSLPKYGTHTQRRAPGGGPGDEVQYAYTSETWAKDLIYSLNHEQRFKLSVELQNFEKTRESAGNSSPVMPLTRKELRQLALFTGLPFVGFGTLDNIIMISAGEYIDTTFGAVLGISTMAAAALGNMVSDVAGIGTAGYVEALCGKIGIKPPNLTPQQVDLKKTKIVSALGRCIGVCIGCIIGMSPLLFIKKKDDEDESD